MTSAKKRTRSHGASGRRNRLPAICVDEHLDPGVAAAFRETFRVIEVAKTTRLKGRDERDFIPELYRENAIFVTSDAECVNDAIEKRLRHAGVVYVPPEMTEDEKVLFAEIVGGFIRGGCSGATHVFRGAMLYPGYDGLRTVRRKVDKMEFSWAWLSEML